MKKAEKTKTNSGEHKGFWKSIDSVYGLSVDFRVKDSVPMLLETSESWHSVWGQMTELQENSVWEGNSYVLATFSYASLHSSSIWKYHIVWIDYDWLTIQLNEMGSIFSPSFLWCLFGLPSFAEIFSSRHGLAWNHGKSCESNPWRMFPKFFGDRSDVYWCECRRAAEIVALNSLYAQSSSGLGGSIHTPESGGTMQTCTANL